MINQNDNIDMIIIMIMMIRMGGANNYNKRIMKMRILVVGS